MDPCGFLSRERHWDVGATPLQAVTYVVKSCHSYHVGRLEDWLKCRRNFLRPSIMWLDGFIRSPRLDGSETKGSRSLGVCFRIACKLWSESECCPCESDPRNKPGPESDDAPLNHLVVAQLSKTKLCAMCLAENCKTPLPLQAFSSGWCAA